MTALIVVDIQNDFLPGGALAVPGGDRIVPLVNGLMPGYDLVVATQDWHPANHASFAPNHPGKTPGESIDLAGLTQILWPIHCVQGTPGAEFPGTLQHQRFDHVVRKGTDPQIDSYSGFFDNGKRQATGLTRLLRENGVTTVHIVGLATDYCVKFTALDAVAEGFATTLITDATRGVDLTPGDIDRALQELQTAGVTLTFLRNYQRTIVGARQHEEYWIPTDQLDDLNHNIDGPIEAITTIGTPTP